MFYSPLLSVAMQRPIRAPLVRRLIHGCLSLLLTLFVTQAAFARANVVDLLDEIEAGNVRIQVTGNGGSTGTVVTGYLINTTKATKRVKVNLDRPLYLRNRNRSAQNMIATEVYKSEPGSDQLRYRSAGSESFINLGANERARIVFVAYCADFEKENPGADDGFTVGRMPPHLISIADKARAYRANGQDDITIAVQIAFWLKQGVSEYEIRERFEFTSDDLWLARKLIR